MRLSVLDLVPVRAGQTSADAVAASMALVTAAEAAGAHRYWFAEHHNMPSVASTSPPVLIAAAAARTRRMRVGSGGVMLPNHAPFIVAEQFAALEALAPGRIDLGIGRAPGSDPVITQVLRGTQRAVERFPDDVADIASLMAPGGSRLRLASGGEYAIAATPDAASSPVVWLLGSSDYSARLAAELGLPYVYANHFFTAGERALERAMELYRRGFRPSERHPEPVSFVTTTAVVAAEAAAARRLALPQARAFARLRLGRPPRPLESVDEAHANPDPQLDDLAAELITRWVVDDPARAAERVRRLAADHAVDEVMVSPAAGATLADPSDRMPGREDTVRLLAATLADR